MSVFFFKVFGADLFADDLRSDKVLFRKTKPHLFKYKLHLLLLFH